MEIKNLVNDQGMYLYKDTSFNTIKINMSFIANPNSREGAIYDLLCRYIVKANKKIPQESIEGLTSDLYSLIVEVDTEMYYNYRFFNFTLDLVSPTVVNDDYSKDAFNFAKKILLYPDFKRKDILEAVKRTIIYDFKEKFQNNFNNSMFSYFDKVFPKKERSYYCDLDINYIENLFNTITLKDLEKLYHQTINKKQFYRGFVFGNITDQEYKYFRKTFTYKSRIPNLGFKYDIIPKEDTIIIPCENTEQSHIYLTYSIDKLDDNIRFILHDILNGSSSLCHNIIRDKYGLSYSPSAYIFNSSNMLYVYAAIDKKNIDTFIKAVDEIIKTLQDEEKMKPLFERAKESVKLNDYLISENRDEMFEVLNSYIMGATSFAEIDEQFDNIKEEDITKSTKTLKRVNTFIYRGDAK